MNNEGWLIYDENSYRRNKWFADELVKNLNCRLIIVQRLEYGVDNGIYFKYDGKHVEKPLYAVQRCIYPMLSYTLELSGCRLFNSARINDICNDKRKTQLLGARLDIPMVKTVFEDKRFYKDGNKVVFPAVCKAAAGHGGSEVFWLKNNADLTDAMEKIEGDDILFQQPAMDLGIDKRVYVLGGEILAGVKRRGEGFKSNFSLGGSAELCNISADETDIVHKIVNELKPDFVGIDFIYNDGQPLLNEVEDIAGTRMLYELTNLDAAKLYAGYILTKI